MMRFRGFGESPLLYHFALVVSFAATTSRAALSADVELADVTAKTGISFRHVAGSREKDWITEVNGSGVALFDFDRDGDLDVYFVNCGRELVLESGAGRTGANDPHPRPRNELWRNEGAFRFVDATPVSGLGDEGWGSGACVADVDNDGDLDVYVTNLGPNALYLNQGDGSFAHAKESGAEDPAWSTSASFADFDRDGFVDIYVANYLRFRADPRKRRGASECTYKGVPIFCGPGGLEPASDSLFLNRGGGRFEDVSETYGVRAPGAAYGLGTLAVDIERDGWPDIVVANDTNPNFCFLNRSGKGFVEAALFLGLAYNDYGVPQAGMGLAAADLRACGREDILVTNFEDDTNTLYRAEEGGTFVESTWPAGLGSTSRALLGWGAVFLDIEGDGDLDLFVANGHVAPQADELRGGEGYRQPNQLFENDGTGRFRENAKFAAAEASRKKSSRGAAAGDLDGDGDPDIVVSNIDDAPCILENRSHGPAERWLRVELAGRASNRAAIGARVTLESGTKKQLRTVRSGESFASQCALAPSFALEPGIDAGRIIVEWPNGGTQVVPFDRDDRSLRIVETP